MTPRQRREHDANLRNAAILQLCDRVADLEYRLALALERIAALEPKPPPQVFKQKLPRVRVVK
jgi:hypothetical protein